MGQLLTPLAAGTVAQGCCHSGNGRLYPCTLLRREVQRLQGSIAKEPLLGELLHPASTSASFASIDPAAASHQVLLRQADHLHQLEEAPQSNTPQVLELNWQQHRATGVFQLLDNPAGRAAQRLYRAGGSLGASLRCWSSQHATAGHPGTIVAEDLCVIRSESSTGTAAVSVCAASSRSSLWCAASTWCASQRSAAS